MILLAPAGVPGRWTGALWFAPLVWWTPPAPGPGELRAAFLDVGHGLAVVVETRERVLVYDTGDVHGADIVASHLAWRGRRSIDTIVVSHADSDHAGGYPSLAARLPARDVLANEGVPGATPCVAGHSWTWDGVAFEVLHPPSADWRGNDGSCVLRVSAAGRNLLLAGDIETRAERRLVRGAGEDLRADLVSAPHHGSRTSSSPAFLDAVAANHAVFSVRHGNAWNLPHPAVLDRYRARGTRDPPHGRARRGHRVHPVFGGNRCPPLAGRAVLARALNASRTADGGRRPGRTEPDQGRAGGPHRGGGRYPVDSPAGGKGAPAAWGASKPVPSPRSLHRGSSALEGGRSARHPLPPSRRDLVRTPGRARGRLLAPLSLPYAAAVGIRRALFRGGCGRLVEWACRSSSSATSRSGAPERRLSSYGWSTGFGNTDSVPA